MQSIEPPAVGQLDWPTIVAIEPRLAMLERSLRAIPRRYRTWRRWESVKRTLSGLVGWHARRPELASSECYDIVYRYLLGIFEGRRGVR